MEILRRGEAGVIPFRAGRYFTIDSAWYFSSREGLDHGPFDSKHHAETGLEQFLEQIRQFESKLKA